MNVHDYLIDQDGRNWGELLSGWHDLLPAEFTVWLVNRFGDVFLVPADGSVQMLDVGGGQLRRLADSRERFAELLDEADHATQWLMMPLVDACVAAEMRLAPDQCYGFKVPPMLGGEYEVDNVEPTDVEVHYGLLGDIHQQTKDLPDGTKVTLKVI